MLLLLAALGAIYRGIYYICGGVLDSGQIMADCFKLDLAMYRREWTQIGTMEESRSNSLLAAYEDKVK